MSAVPPPAVSVVIPAYNSAPFVAATLESVFAQTFRDYEVIVVNDGSPDTHALEAAIEPWRSRITYLTQPNTGPSGARNLGIQQARGTYIALLDSDDLWMAEYLERQMRRLQSDPGLDLLYSDGVILGGPLDGRRLMEVTPSHREVTVERLITEECTVLTSCTVVRRDAVIRAGLFDVRFHRSEDAHLWVRLAVDGCRLAWQPDVTVWHRRRAGSLSTDTTAMVRAYVDVLEDLERRLPFSPAQRTLVTRQIARRRALMAFNDGKALFVAGRYPEAAEALARARQVEPVTGRQIRFGLIQMGVRLAPRLLHRAYDLMHQAA